MSAKLRFENVGCRVFFCCRKEPAKKIAAPKINKAGKEEKRRIMMLLNQEAEERGRSQIQETSYRIVALKKDGSDGSACPIIPTISTVFGSDFKSTSVHVDSEEVAPKHCQITTDARGNAYVEGLTVEFSTELNGVELLGKQQLTNGDIIEMGGRKFRIDKIQPKTPIRMSWKTGEGERKDSVRLWTDKPSGIPIPKSAKICRTKSKYPVLARKSTGESLRKTEETDQTKIPKSTLTPAVKKFMASSEQSGIGSEKVTRSSAKRKPPPGTPAESVNGPEVVQFVDPASGSATKKLKSPVGVLETESPVVEEGESGRSFRSSTRSAAKKQQLLIDLSPMETTSNDLPVTQDKSPGTAVPLSIPRMTEMSGDLIDFSTPNASTKTARKSEDLMLFESRLDFMENAEQAAEEKLGELPEDQEEAKENLGRSEESGLEILGESTKEMERIELEVSGGSNRSTPASSADYLSVEKSHNSSRRRGRAKQSPELRKEAMEFELEISKSPDRNMSFDTVSTSSGSKSQASSSWKYQKSISAGISSGDEQESFGNDEQEIAKNLLPDLMVESSRSELANSKGSEKKSKAATPVSAARKSEASDEIGISETVRKSAVPEEPDVVEEMFDKILARVDSPRKTRSLSPRRRSRDSRKLGSPIRDTEGNIVAESPDVILDYANWKTSTPAVALKKNRKSASSSGKKRRASSKTSTRASVGSVQQSAISSFSEESVDVVEEMLDKILTKVESPTKRTLSPRRLRDSQKLGSPVREVEENEPLVVSVAVPSPTKEEQESVSRLFSPDKADSFVNKSGRKTKTPKSNSPRRKMRTPRLSSKKKSSPLSSGTTPKTPEQVNVSDVSKRKSKTPAKSKSLIKDDESPVDDSKFHTPKETPAEMRKSKFSPSKSARAAPKSVLKKQRSSERLRAATSVKKGRISKLKGQDSAKRIVSFSPSVVVTPIPRIGRLSVRNTDMTPNLGFEDSDSDSSSDDSVEYGSPPEISLYDKDWRINLTGTTKSPTPRDSVSSGTENVVKTPKQRKRTSTPLTGVKSMLETPHEEEPKLYGRRNASSFIVQLESPEPMDWSDASDNKSRSFGSQKSPKKSPMRKSTDSVGRRSPRNVVVESPERNITESEDFAKVYCQVYPRRKSADSVVGRSTRKSSMDSFEQVVARSQDFVSPRKSMKIPEVSSPRKSVDSVAEKRRSPRKSVAETLEGIVAKVAEESASPKKSQILTRKSADTVPSGRRSTRNSGMAVSQTVHSIVDQVEDAVSPRKQPKTPEKEPEEESLEESWEDSPRYPGLKQLMNTPRDRKSVKLTGVKRLLRSAKKVPEPSLVGVKEIMKSEKKRANLNLSGVKKLVKTPKKQMRTPLGGLKNLVKTPRRRESPRLAGVKEMMKPAEMESRGKEMNLVGVKETLRSPRHKEMVFNYSGVKEMMKSPKKKRSVSMDGITRIMEVPERKIEVVIPRLDAEATKTSANGKTKKKSAPKNKASTKPKGTAQSEKHQDQKETEVRTTRATRKHPADEKQEISKNEEPAVKVSRTTRQSRVKAQTSKGAQVHQKPLENKKDQENKRATRRKPAKEEKRENKEKEEVVEKVLRVTRQTRVKQQSSKETSVKKKETGLETEKPARQTRTKQQASEAKQQKLEKAETRSKPETELKPARRTRAKAHTSDEAKEQKKVEKSAKVGAKTEQPVKRVLRPRK